MFNAIVRVASSGMFKRRVVKLISGLASALAAELIARKVLKRFKAPDNIKEDDLGSVMKSHQVLKKQLKLIVTFAFSFISDVLISGLDKKGLV